MCRDQAMGHRSGLGTRELWYICNCIYRDMLFKRRSFGLLSRDDFNDGNANVFIGNEGTLNNNNVDNSNGVRPSISS